MENHPGALADQRIPQRVRMSAKDLEAKFSTKRECFSFLTIDCKAYLPAYDTVTIYFLKDLIAGRKKCKCPTYPAPHPVSLQSSGRTSAGTCKCRSTSP